MLSRSTVGLLWLLTLACAPPPDDGSTAGQIEVDDWLLLDPANAGVDPALLQTMTADIRDGQWGDIHAVLVARDGQLVYEAYFSGDEEHIKDGTRRVQFGPNVRHGLRSVSKSFTATLVGIAIDQGLIPSVNTPLSELLPEHAAYCRGEKAALTLKHLLTMSAGLEWREGSSDIDDQDALAASADPVAFVLGRDSRTPPGEAFRYSGGLTQVLAAVVEQASGMPLAAYADQVLFRPLGIEHWEWVTLGSANPSAFSGLRLTARDMAKLGQVYLDGGRWRERRIVSSDWVFRATEPYLEFRESGAPPFVQSSGYGFHWWQDVHRWGGGTMVFQLASGNGGQRIILVRELNLVVAMFGGMYDEPSLSWNPEFVVREYILPAVDHRRLADEAEAKLPD